MSAIDDIKQFKKLLDEGVITQEEFDEKKRQILAGETAAESEQPSLTPAVPVERKKTKIAAGLLGLFLGGLGIHKFYLGYTEEGAILLFANLFGILISAVEGDVYSSVNFGAAISGTVMLVVIIEGIMYLVKNDDAFQRIYVENKRAWF